MHPKKDLELHYHKYKITSETRYSASELECGALVWAIKLFDVYLRDKPFKVFTDHTALKGIRNMKATNSRLEKWSGKNNTNVDCLSREPVQALMSITEVSKNMIREQREDPIFKNIINKILESEDGKIRNIHNQNR